MQMIHSRKNDKEPEFAGVEPYYRGEFQNGLPLCSNKKIFN